MSADLTKLRLLMARLAEHRNTRVNSFSAKLPTDWGPEKIENPQTGFPFSDDSAWLLIAELLENKDQEVDLITLKKPPGQEAIEILYKLTLTTTLYIKVHLGAGNKVIGRSFHVSYKY